MLCAFNQKIFYYISAINETGDHRINTIIKTSWPRISLTRDDRKDWWIKLFSLENEHFFFWQSGNSPKNTWGFGATQSSPAANRVGKKVDGGEMPGTSASSFSPVQPGLSSVSKCSQDRAQLALPSALPWCPCIRMATNERSKSSLFYFLCSASHSCHLCFVCIANAFQL